MQLFPVKLEAVGVLLTEKGLHEITEAVAQKWSVKKVLFEITPNSQVNTCLGVPFLIKLSTSFWCFYC